MQRKESLSYLAGIFDGEGCISIDKHMPPIRKGWNYSPVYEVSIEVAMTDHSIPHLFQSSFGGSAKTSARRNYKLITRWRMTGTSCLPFLTSLLPYVLIKRRQFEVALHLLRNIRTGRRGCKSRLTDEELVLREADYTLAKQLKAESV